MIQLFLERSLCMMEEDIGRMLVFPSQFRRDRPITEHPEVIIAYSLAGELSMIFTTLVVRLWYSGNFEKKEIWQNAVEFAGRGGSIIGFGILAVARHGAGGDGSDLFLLAHFGRDLVEAFLVDHGRIRFGRKFIKQTPRNRLCRAVGVAP